MQYEEKTTIISLDACGIIACFGSKGSKWYAEGKCQRASEDAQQEWCFVSCCTRKVDGIIPTQEVAKVKKPKTIARLPRRDVAVTDTVQYFAIAQSFHRDYTFIYEGGDTYSYNIGLAINGTKATITNLFDMYNQSATEWARSYDYPVDGTYDAAAKTITIPTTVNGIVCGNYGGYYDTYLLAGNVSTSGTIDPAESLVLMLLPTMLVTSQLLLQEQTLQ